MMKEDSLRRVALYHLVMQVLTFALSMSKEVRSNRNKYYTFVMANDDSNGCP